MATTAAVANMQINRGREITFFFFFLNMQFLSKEFKIFKYNCFLKRHFVMSFLT